MSLLQKRKKTCKGKRLQASSATERDFKIKKTKISKVRAYKNSTKETRSSLNVHQQQDDELLHLIDKLL